jgi:hypothetical protein
VSRALLREKTAAGKPIESRLRWFALLLPRLVCKIAMDAEGDTEFFLRQIKYGPHAPLRKAMASPGTVLQCPDREHFE